RPPWTTRSCAPSNRPSRHDHRGLISNERLEDADAGALVALFPLVPAHPGGIHVLGQGPQGGHGRLVLRRVLERIPIKEPARVLPGDLLDVRVAACGVLELLPGEFGGLWPRRVGVWVVALPRNDVDADSVAKLQPGRVGDVAGQDVVAEHVRGLLAPEIILEPSLVLEVAIGTVQVEGDPADAALGEGDLEAREAPQGG